MGFYVNIRFLKVENPFQGKSSYPFQGGFLGNRAAPGCCIEVLELLIQEMHQRGYTTMIKSSIQQDYYTME